MSETPPVQPRVARVTVVAHCGSRVMGEQLLAGRGGVLGSRSRLARQWIQRSGSNLGNSEWSIGIRGGQMYLRHHYPALGVPAPGIRLEGQPYTGRRGKWFYFRSVRYPNWVTFETEFPVAIVVVALAILPISKGLRRQNWQKRTVGDSTCPACSYNLTGNTSGTCPECGSPVASRPA